jgi:hypothetical protein
MSLENDMFEGTLNELEGIYKKVDGMKNHLLEIPLQQFEILFTKDKEGKPVFEALDKKATQELIDTLEKEIIPLFEENKHQSGLDKANSYLKLFQENLEK